MSELSAWTLNNLIDPTNREVLERVNAGANEIIEDDIGWYGDDYFKTGKNGYLGEFPIDIAETPYADYTTTDWAMYFIGRYGQIDGSHHKTWVLDQVARILTGTQVIVTVRKWRKRDGTFHTHHDVNLAESTAEYNEWVEEMLDRDEDGEPQYDYDTGIAP